MNQKTNGFFSKSFMDSKIKSANKTAAESWLGYFFGPCFMSMIYCAVAGTYLTQFYTDVLGMKGIILTMMPFLCKIIDAITNIIMGRIIDKTRTNQGKARPWILISGVCITIAGILLYTVPQDNETLQIVWVVFSYNLFFAFAYTIYNMSHMLMVPLSTRNTKQRDTLALLTSTGASLLPGMLVTIIMPFAIRTIGVGAASQGNWIKMMGLISVLAIPGTLIEYYFTKERVTEEAIRAGEYEKHDNNSFITQAKAAIADPYWMIVMGITIVNSIITFLATNSMVYYCNWVLADSVDGGAGMQVLVNMIGQAPLGIGIIVLWPIVGKFGKRRTMMFGFGLAAIGSLITLLTSHIGMGPVLAGLVIKSIGMIPAYLLNAQLAEALDHIEYTNRFRADGFSASLYSIIATVSVGIGQTILLSGISAFGYISPVSSAQSVVQPMAVQNFFVFCFVGAPMIGYLIMSLCMIRFDVEDKIPVISAEIAQRRKDECEARGEIYLTPDEIAAKEQKENDRIAEENRIKELKEKCMKKGLNFDEEEAKYQAKKKEAEAKAAEKRVKKEAKKRK